MKHMMEDKAMPKQMGMKKGWPDKMCYAKGPTVRKGT